MNIEQANEELVNELRQKYLNANNEQWALGYRLSEDKQMIVNSLCGSKPEFNAPLTCTGEERFYADFLLANRISSNRQHKQIILDRVKDWREDYYPDYGKSTIVMKRANLARRIYKRIIKWLRK